MSTTPQLSPTVENYLKQIYLAEEELKGKWITTGQIARFLGVTPGTATAMAQKLAARSLANYQTHKGVQLNKQGRARARFVLLRHRLMEYFLVHVLDMPWHEVHAEAEILEHALSPKVITHLDAFLGHPTRDPHGDPILREGEQETSSGQPLIECQINTHFRIKRLLKQNAKFLEFAQKTSLIPSATFLLLSKNEEAATLELHPLPPHTHVPTTLSFATARQILVEPLTPPTA